MSSENENRNNIIVNNTDDDNDDHNQVHPSATNNNNDEFPPQSKLACPVDFTCLWTGPKWAVTTWVSSAAGLLGLNPENETDITTSIQRGNRSGNLSARRRRSNPTYVPLTTSTDSINSGTNAAEEYLDSDDDDDESIQKKKKKLPSPKNNPYGGIGTIVNQVSFLSGIAQATFGNPQNAIPLSAEFEVWQKYIRDLSNFSALDIDVAIIASSTDRAAPCPYVHLTIRGPIIPSLGRCRRPLDHPTTSFVTPQSEEDWQAANPIAVLEVVEAFLLSVVAPESVEDDDTIETIVEAGTPILAHPALELQEFLKSVADFVKEKCLGVKLVIRDIDFTAEFESARQQHAERFLVLDSTASSASSSTTTIIAREPRNSSSASSIVGNMFTAPMIVTRNAFTGESDHGCCPTSAVNAFEADYTMLDIVRASRNLIRRVIQNVSSLKSIEVRGCLMRDTDLDVNGILAGRSSLLAITEHLNDKKNKNTSNEDHEDEPFRREDSNDGENGDNENGTNSNSNDDRCFPYRSGFVASEVKRISGPTRLVIEHCGLTDGHLSALIRLLRIEAEKSRRNASQVHHSEKDGILSTHFLTSISSLRISGQFLPMTIMGLMSSMQDTFDDAKLAWAKKRQQQDSLLQQDKFVSVEERAGRIPFPLEEIELPASAVHVVRDGILARGVGSNIVVRSTD